MLKKIIWEINRWVGDDLMRKGGKTAAIVANSAFYQCFIVCAASSPKPKKTSRPELKEAKNGGRKRKQKAAKESVGAVLCPAFTLLRWFFAMGRLWIVTTLCKTLTFSPQASGWGGVIAYCAGVAFWIPFGICKFCFLFLFCFRCVCILVRSVFFLSDCFIYHARWKSRRNAACICLLMKLD